MIGTKLQCIDWLREQPSDKRFEVKEKRKRRTLTQNAYYWVMVNQLARTLGMGDMELHNRLLREYGVRDAFEVSADVPLSDYFEYYDALNDYHDRNGKTVRTVYVYKGSSRMDSAEFAHLVNGLRDECELQGIDVRTPQEIAAMEYVRGDV